MIRLISQSPITSPGSDFGQTFDLVCLTESSVRVSVLQYYIAVTGKQEL